MSLTKKAVADLAQNIREARVIAFAHADGDSGSKYACFVGALESTIAHFIQKHMRDSTEVRAAFSYEPTADEVRDYQAQQAKWRADYEARKAAAANRVRGAA